MISKIRIAIFFLLNGLILNGMEPIPKFEPKTESSIRIKFEESRPKMPERAKAEISAKAKIMDEQKKIKDQEIQKRELSKKTITPVEKMIDITNNMENKSINLLNKNEDTIFDVQSVKLNNQNSFDLSAPITQNYPSVGIEDLESGSHEKSYAMEIARDKVKDNYTELLQKTIQSLSSIAPNDTKNLEDFLDEHIEEISHALLNIHAPSKKSESSINIYKEIQYLANQIRIYSNQTVYTDINAMIDFIYRMNLFIEQSHLVLLSNNIVKNLNKAYSVTIIASNIFKPTNIVFDLNQISHAIQDQFITPITTSQNFPNITNSRDMMTAIYETNGSMEQIIKSWQDAIQINIHDKMAHQDQISLITFALIFQSTMAAVTSILNETSKKYKITEPLPIYSYNAYTTMQLPTSNNPQSI